MYDDNSTIKKIATAAVKRKIYKYLLSLSLPAVSFILIAFLVLAMFTAHEAQNQTSNAVSSDEIINRFVEIALGENGTVGGDKYSTWYHGYPTGLSWCSMFVSWAANEAGLIDGGIIPKEQLCYNGIQWFKQRDRFQYTNHYGGNNYTPKRGDIIYFTWNSVKDPPFGHVGIVMFVEGDNVITIEGNTNNNRCAIRTRNRLSSTVLGYGTPDYASISGGAGSIALEGNSAAEKVWNFFKAKGFSNEAIAGIMGNIHQESSMNPAAIESNGQGHGLCQWSFGRRTRLFERASAAGKPWQDIELQLTLLWDELCGLDSATKFIMDKKYGGLESFKQTDSIVWAVEAFEKSFERAGKPVMTRRIEYARKYYNMFAGGN